MTDRIWVQPDPKGMSITSVWPYDPEAQRNLTEYVRADVARAQNAAAYEAAEAAIYEMRYIEAAGMPSGWKERHAALGEAAAAIRALASDDDRAALDRLIAEAVEREKRAEWQPIETGPRDGTPFLTFSRDAADDPREGALGYQSTAMVVMAWLPADDRPFPVDEHGDWNDWHCYEPTHWRPLPEPPARGEED